MRKRARNRSAISHCGNGIGKEGQPAFPLKGNRCALRPFRENRNYTAISPLGKGMRRVTPANKERRLRTSERKPRARKSRNVVCAAVSEYRNAAFSSHEDKDRAGPKRELLHCAVRFRVEQHRPPPSESFTTASSPILMAAAIVGPTTRSASTSTISFRIVPRNNGNSTKHHHSAMFSAANDTLLPVRSRRGRDDRAAGEKKLLVGDEAGRPSNADRAQGRTQGARQREHLVRRRRAARSRMWASPRNSRATRTKREGAVREPRAPPPPRQRETKTLKRSTQEWQDPRAVHDLRGARSEKGPFLARSSRGASPNARLRGFSDAWRAYLAEAGSFRMHGGNMLPGRGVFPVRGPFGNA